MKSQLVLASNDQKILVTGASGALGKALLPRLKVDFDGSRIFAPRRGAADSQLDLHNAEKIVDLIKKISPSIIFHLAATFSNNLEEARTINVVATQKIFETIELLGLNTRVVLVGSAAEYGLVSETDNPINEGHVLRPVTVYGLTKSWQAELFHFYASKGCNVVLARIFNLLGSNLSEKLFIGKLYKQIDEIRQGVRNVIELGSLRGIRDYIPIGEAVNQLIQIAKLGLPGHIYHVASGEPIVMADLLDRELIKNNIEKNGLVKVNMDLSKEIGVRCIYANIEKTKSLIY